MKGCLVFRALTVIVSRFEADTNVRMRFVVGLLQDSGAQAAMHEEQQAHKDFLVVRVQETYDNLVLKVHTCHYDSVGLLHEYRVKSCEAAYRSSCAS